VGRGVRVEVVRTTEGMRALRGRITEALSDH